MITVEMNLFFLALTENNKSDEQERATDQQEARGCPRESLFESPTGHSLYRRASVREEECG